MPLFKRSAFASTNGHLRLRSFTPHAPTPVDDLKKCRDLTLNRELNTSCSNWYFIERHNFSASGGRLARGAAEMEANATILQCPAGPVFWPPRGARTARFW